MAHKPPHRDNNGKMFHVVYSPMSPNSEGQQRPVKTKEEGLKKPHRNANMNSHLESKTQESQQIQVISEQKSSKVSSGWIAAIILGIICFILLGTSAFFAIKYFQASCKHPSSNTHTFEYKNTSSHIENRCFSKDQLNSEKNGKAYKNKWFCCGEKCYYISNDYKTFEESRKFCIDLGSSLLKIENKDEQEFIQSLLSYFYWIGLSRKGSSSPWTWEDGSLMHYNLFLQDSNINTNCVYIASSKMAAALCSKSYSFICAKHSNSDLGSVEENEVKTV